MIAVRIVAEAKSATQSGKARVGRWRLEVVADEAPAADPLMGWAGSGDTGKQVRLTFDSAAAATDYARAQGFSWEIVPLPPHRLKLQAYADNFR